jgi:hypothetical protein
MSANNSDENNTKVIANCYNQAIAIAFELENYIVTMPPGLKG